MMSTNAPPDDIAPSKLSGTGQRKCQVTILPRPELMVATGPNEPSPKHGDTTFGEGKKGRVAVPLPS